MATVALPVFVNCTPHAINLIDVNGNVTTLPKGEVVPRLTQATLQVNEINGISITETTFGDTRDLPTPVAGTYFIVSRMILEANKDRNDLLVPNELVRDEAGQIIGCKSLACN